MKDSFIKLAIGGTGIGATELVSSAVQINPSIISDVVGLLSQIAIAIVTIIGIFKRKKTE